jgi:hypothetical protein
MYVFLTPTFLTVILFSKSSKNRFLLGNRSGLLGGEIRELSIRIHQPETLLIGWVGNQNLKALFPSF